MDIGVSNRVIARNSIGRFIEACSEAAFETVQDSIKEGAKLSREMAPVGHKHDSRTIPLRDSIEWTMTGRTSGHWQATARHALPQELSAAPHEIVGSPGLRFFWEARGRMFEPAEIYYNEPGLVTVVSHPGNPAQPYLRPAYEIVMGHVMQIAAEKYPG